MKATMISLALLLGLAVSGIGTGVALAQGAPPASSSWNTTGGGGGGG